MAKQITISANDIVVLEGIAKSGKNVGKPYSFAKLDSRLGNNSTFVEAAKAAGAKVIGAKEASTFQVS